MLDWDEFKKVDQSRPPLRWFANGCETLGHYCLGKYLYWLENNNEKKMMFWSKLSNVFYRPYKRWGTFYEYIVKVDENDTI